MGGALGPDQVGVDFHIDAVAGVETGDHPPIKSAPGFPGALSFGDQEFLSGEQMLPLILARGTGGLEGSHCHEALVVLAGQADLRRLKAIIGQLLL